MTDTAIVPLEAPAAAQAATLAILYPTTRGVRLILTRRPTTMRRHPGQIAFPGGMVEPSDRSPLAAAIREADEEIGLRLPPDPPAQPLTPVGTVTSGIVIQPFLVHLPNSPRLRAAPDEVAEILRVPLADLAAPGCFVWHPHPRRPGAFTPAFNWRDHLIWGATARTVVEILEIEGLPPLPPAPSPTRGEGESASTVAGSDSPSPLVGEGAGGRGGT